MCHTLLQASEKYIPHLSLSVQKSCGPAGKCNKNKNDSLRMCAILDEVKKLMVSIMGCTMMRRRLKRYEWSRGASDVFDFLVCNEWMVVVGRVRIEKVDANSSSKSHSAG